VKPTELKTDKKTEIKTPVANLNTKATTLVKKPVDV
jgi:hypothetical protein